MSDTVHMNERSTERRSKGVKRRMMDDDSTSDIHSHSESESASAAAAAASAEMEVDEQEEETTRMQSNKRESIFQQILDFLSASGAGHDDLDSEFLLEQFISQHNRCEFTKEAIKEAKTLFLTLCEDSCSHFQLSVNDFESKLVEADAAVMRQQLLSVSAPVELQAEVIKALQKRMCSAEVNWQRKIKETLRTMFITDVLTEIVYHLKEKECDSIFRGELDEVAELRIDFESNINVGETRYRGPVEEVIAYNQIIMVVVQAKSEAIFEGALQCLLALHGAWMRNQSHREEMEFDFPIYGIVSTMDRWLFVRYDGRRVEDRLRRICQRQPNPILHAFSILVHFIFPPELQ